MWDIGNRRIFADVIAYVFPHEHTSLYKPYIQTKFKSWKSLLTRTIGGVFSSLQAILKEIAAIENFEIDGCKKINEPYILCKISSF